MDACRASWVLVFVAAGGCVSGGGRVPSRPDAGRTSIDAAVEEGMLDSGPRDARALSDAENIRDAGTPADARGSTDTGPSIDASVPDGGTVLDAGRADGGTAGDAGAGGDASSGDVTPSIDGVVGALEWEGAVFTESTEPTDWTGNTLRSLRALLTDDALYIAIEGSVDSGNAIVLYLDRAEGGVEGVVLTSASDDSGALDDAITPSEPFTTYADFRADLAWGTRVLGRAAADFDDEMGWRDFVRASAPDDLYWIDSTIAPTTCGDEACETRLPRDVLDLGDGAVRPRTIALFARIMNHDGAQSPNQTLPEDDSEAPRVVSVALTLDEE
jgi:hypothetical protein